MKGVGTAIYSTTRRIMGNKRGITQGDVMTQFPTAISFIRAAEDQGVSIQGLQKRIKTIYSDYGAQASFAALKGQEAAISSEQKTRDDTASGSTVTTSSDKSETVVPMDSSVQLSNPIGVANRLTASGVADQADPAASHEIRDKQDLIVPMVDDAIQSALSSAVAPERAPATAPDFTKDAITTVQEEKYQELDTVQTVLQAAVHPTLPAAAVVGSGHDGGNMREAIPADRTLFSEPNRETAELDSTHASGYLESVGNKRRAKDQYIALHPTSTSGRGALDLSSLGLAKQDEAKIQTELANRIISDDALSDAFLRMLKDLVDTGFQMGSMMRLASFLSNRWIAAAILGAGVQGLSASTAGFMVIAYGVAKYIIDYLRESGTLTKEQITTEWLHKTILNKVLGVQSDVQSGFYTNQGAPPGGIPQKGSLASISDVNPYDELHASYDEGVSDGLRKFLPSAMESDVELDPGENLEKKETFATFNGYKPTNWPLGNVDNKLFVDNLVTLGIRYTEPLQELPERTIGGTILGANPNYSNRVNADAESDELLLKYTTDPLCISNIGSECCPMASSKLLEKSIYMDARVSMSLLAPKVLEDPFFVFNPKAQGVQGVLAQERESFNPLATNVPMIPDLQRGGGQSLRYDTPMPPDAFTTGRQHGARPTYLASDQTLFTPLRNPVAALPSVWA